MKPPSVWESSWIAPKRNSWCMIELINGAYRKAWFGLHFFHDGPHDLVVYGRPCVRWRYWKSSP